MADLDKVYSSKLCLGGGSMKRLIIIIAATVCGYAFAMSAFVPSDTRLVLPLRIVRASLPILDRIPRGISPSTSSGQAEFVLAENEI
jgi:hypothetical protein